VILPHAQAPIRYDRAGNALPSLTKAKTSVITSAGGEDFKRSTGHVLRARLPCLIDDGAGKTANRDNRCAAARQCPQPARRLVD